MSCKNVELSSLAFVKLQLHLAKYPHHSVNGVMLGCKQRFADDRVLEIVDVIPLFHQSLQLTPMLEIALTNVDAHCFSKELFIAAYYEAPEQLNARTDPSQFSIRVADKIKLNSPESRLVIINNRFVPTTDSLIFYSSDSGSKKWTKSDDAVTYEESTKEITNELLDRKAYRDLVDFDNHLCDVSQHWLNQPLNRLIRMG